MAEPAPDRPLAARLLALRRDTEAVCAALERAVASWADTLDRVEPVHLGEIPAALECPAEAVEDTRRGNRRAALWIAGAGGRDQGSPGSAAGCNGEVRR